MTITMDARTMTVTYSGGMTATYHLDGSKSRNKGVQGTEVVSTAKWHGATLVVTTKLELGDAVVKYSMDDANLRIESIIPFRRFVETPNTPAQGARFGTSVTDKTIVYTKR
jgi:hypothetical protein